MAALRFRGYLIPLFLVLNPTFLAGRSLIRVDEGKTRLVITDNAAVLKLAIVSEADRDLPVKVELQLVDTSDKVIEAVSRNLVVSRGSRSLEVPLQSFLSARQQDESDASWIRLQYRVAVTGPGSNIDDVHGVLSVSEISPQPFALRVAFPANASAGARLHIYVFTTHPISGAPVGDVRITANLTISLDSGDRVLKAAGRSNSSGVATLDFDIPQHLDDPDLTIKVTARSGAFVKEAEEDVRLNDGGQILLTTDKPIYQPGQHLRVRVLAFDSSRKALAKTPLEVAVHDPENAVVYKTQLTTSQFGEADTDWLLPDNVRLGDYSVRVELSDNSVSAWLPVKVSRYDLPAFTISPKPDRPYYLPDQDARVEVRADYLFGQPVKQGHVRIVQEKRRFWDFRNQKWETDEGSTIEGNLDSQGKFLATIDLQEEHDSLAAQTRQRYTDLPYAVYVTDATTNRTEQRRFDIRVTKDDIHIYVNENHNADGFPLEFYLSTFYADGRPAKARVKMYETEHESPDQKAEPASQLLSTINTNRYGVAKFSGLRSDASKFLFIADDGNGRMGQNSESMYRPNSAVRVYSNKTLYRSGDPLQVEIRSTFHTGPVILEVLREGRTLWSSIVQLRNGKAFTVIPYLEEFKDDLTIAAHFAGGKNDDQMFALRGVAYPRNRELQIDTKLNKTSYAPGEEASVVFRTRSPEGLLKPSLIGVVVLDKAVEERARTDGEFAGSRWCCTSCASWMGLGRELSGLTRQELDRLDLSMPVPEDLELAAEALLNATVNQQYYRRVFSEDQDDPAEIFGAGIQRQLDPLKRALDARYARDVAHPTDEDSLKELLVISGIRFDSFRDPWDNLYRPSFSTNRGFDVLKLTSAGPDKIFGSPDDFTALQMQWAYFRPSGETMNLAVKNYHDRTGNFIRDLPALRNEMTALGQNIDSWRDRWGQAYRFEFGIFRKQFAVTVRSSGPDRTFQPESTYASDDFPIWASSIDWTAGIEATLDRAASKFYQTSKTFPETTEQFDEALNLAGMTEGIRDPWMNRCYPTFKTQSYYTDRLSVTSYAQYLRSSSQRVSLVPVTSKIQFLVLRSAGPDGIEGTADDFDVASVSRVLAEQSSDDAVPERAPDSPILQSGAGAIKGIVVDISEARIPGVTVIAKSVVQGTFQATTNESGEYLLANLPSGSYEVSFELPGFMARRIREVPVRSGLTVNLSLALEIGSFNQSVEVSVAADLSLATVSASVSVIREGPRSTPGSSISTPRLREYFPETLLWLPAVETDRAGRAQVKFKLADNITTWKMAAVVSTADGQVGTVEKEIVSFQPFFVEHDPPRSLTQGDEIQLPVVVRNYMDKDQPVDLTLKPADWFTALNGTSRTAQVKAGETTREIFPFKAVKTTNAGKQQIVASGSRAADAIEKTVSVHPDGKEITRTASDIFTNNLSHSIVIPGEAIPGTAHGELRIYPNLMAHVVDGIEGILKRPYGCAEQTISSAYPGLMLLRHYKNTGRESPELAAKARRYLQIGLDRLWAYQDQAGGFSYWGRGSADIALTAYAVQFLADAAEITPVDTNAIRRAQNWLERQQKEDGSWQSIAAFTDRRHNLGLTAYVARVLSRSDLRKVASVRRDSLADALNYLRQQTGEIDEPYALASLAIAASNAGNAEMANDAGSRLQRMAHRETSDAYWDLQTNTPFYGWGFAGRVETTALVVRALSVTHASVDASLIDQGLLFLLRNKDRYGVWYSTQATVNVLGTLMTVVGKSAGSTSPTSLEIAVNGRAVTSVAMPGGDQAVSPIVVDLSQFLSTGENRVELHGTGGARASAQFVENYYVPWAEEAATRPASEPGALRLSVQFDKTDAGVGDYINCRVQAERVGFRGYGMMLAEIGLPPGADVDRASLEEAIKSGGWDLNKYDVLPDRLIAYVWPRAGGTQFDFKFRLRYGIKAQTPASTLYDYYNPDAQITVKPVRFDVR
jgi:A-macroglobulin TED domain/Alpha-2-macroglobulin family/MG2 domain/Carboxypeptidase regulatory-like domain/A-macroglobulin receptor binding domain/Macroglobulin domain MG3